MTIKILTFKECITENYQKNINYMLLISVLLIFLKEVVSRRGKLVLLLNSNVLALIKKNMELTFNFFVKSS